MLGLGSSRAPRYAYQSAVVRTLPPDQAAIVMGSYLTCKGIHLPDDPSPSSLRGEMRQFWDFAHEAAGDYYKDDNLAKKTAWKTTRLFYQDHNGQPIRSSVLPSRQHAPVTYIGNPGDLVGLGVCCEYTYIWNKPIQPNPRNGHNGAARRPIEIPQLAAVKFDEGEEPQLYWSPQTASLYVFPRLPTPNACMRPNPEMTAAEVYQQWAQRPAECAHIVDVPEVDVQLVGNLDTIVYRDDKWHDRNPDPHKQGSQEYIHQFGDGVGIWSSEGTTPEAVVMTGGCLELDPRGLIH